MCAHFSTVQFPSPKCMCFAMQFLFQRIFRFFCVKWVHCQWIKVEIRYWASFWKDCISFDLEESVTFDLSSTNPLYCLSLQQGRTIIKVKTFHFCFFFSLKYIQLNEFLRENEKVKWANEKHSDIHLVE